MDKEPYTSIVESIIATKSFGRSDTYANMLRYLVECTIKGNIPKETTIASDIFGKEGFDPSQSTLIRVYAYNLRKKLAKYYENEGINDSVMIKVPKGSYKVKFVNKAEPEKQKIKPSKVWISATTGFIFLIILIFYNYKTETISETRLWKSILSSEKMTMLVLGDLFIYNEIDSISGKTKTIRNPSINSKEEFETSQLDLTETGVTLEPLSYAFHIRNSVNWVKDLSL